MLAGVAEQIADFRAPAAGDVLMHRGIVGRGGVDHRPDILQQAPGGGVVAAGVEQLAEFVAKRGDLFRVLPRNAVAAIVEDGQRVDRAVQGQLAPQAFEDVVAPAVRDPGLGQLRQPGGALVSRGSPSQVCPGRRTTRKSPSRNAPSVLEANRQRLRGRRAATACWLPGRSAATAVRRCRPGDGPRWRRLPPRRRPCRPAAGAGWVARRPGFPRRSGRGWPGRLPPGSVRRPVGSGAGAGGRAGSGGRAGRRARARGRSCRGYRRRGYARSWWLLRMADDREKSSAVPVAGRLRSCRWHRHRATGPRCAAAVRRCPAAMPRCRGRAWRCRLSG